MLYDSVSDDDIPHTVGTGRRVELVARTEPNECACIVLLARLEELTPWPNPLALSYHHSLLAAVSCTYCRYEPLASEGSRTLMPRNAGQSKICSRSRVNS